MEVRSNIVGLTHIAVGLTHIELLFEFQCDHQPLASTEFFRRQAMGLGLYRYPLDAENFLGASGIQLMCLYIY